MPGLLTLTAGIRNRRCGSAAGAIPPLTRFSVTPLFLSVSRRGDAAPPVTWANHPNALFCNTLWQFAGGSAKIRAGTLYSYNRCAVGRTIPENTGANSPRTAVKTRDFRKISKKSLNPEVFMRIVVVGSHRK